MISDDPVMELPSGKKVRRGDWVLIRAKVAEEERGHPENLDVTLWSKTDEYGATVRKDMVVDKTTQPDGWPLCPHLTPYPTLEVGMLVRCELDSRHSGLHHAEVADQHHDWADTDTVGYMEDKS